MEIDKISLVIGPILSLLITFTGLYLSHRYEMARLAVEKKKGEEEAEANKIRIAAEANKLEAEKDKIVLESGVAQLSYFNSVIDNMRKELDFQSSRGKDNADRIALFEAKLVEADVEKKVLAEENGRLKKKVEDQEKKIEDQEKKIISQELEIIELRNKIEGLERRSTEG